MSNLATKFKNITLPGRIALAILLFGVGYGIKWIITDSGIIPKSVKESVVTTVDNLPPLKYDKNANAPEADLPSTTPASLQIPEIRCGIMGWNAQTGLMFANGGEVTMEGSFMAQNNVNVRLINQNNCNEQAKELLAFAQDYASGNRQSQKGYHFIAWMGDGVPSYIAGLNEQIKKTLGEEYIAQVFFAAGSSFGEDKLMGPAIWKSNPQLARGSLIVGVIKDGDWNIAMKYFGDNNVPVNNDPTTYDPDAVNWMNTDDYIKASQIYIQGSAETRPIVRNKKRLGRDTTITPTAVVTWTPGDVIVAEQKRDLISIASTKEYSAQMPCTFIGIKKYLQENRKLVESFILATCLGGDQVKSHGKALKFAANISAQVYKDLKGEDWEKYYKGFTMNDNKGNIVELGGSRVWNLADNAEYFGLNGGTNKYEAVYKTFGDLVVKCYPEDVPSYPPYSEVVDLSYLKNVYAQNKNNSKMTVASTPQFSENQSMTSLISSKSVTVEFEFGSSRISQSALSSLKQIANDLIIADNTLVTIEGHTDDVGNDEQNMSLSQQRADAIKEWLLHFDRKIFNNRITSIGYGEEKPVADNATESGRQKNRRVEIKIGK